MTQLIQSLYLSWLFIWSAVLSYQQNAVFLLKKHYFAAPLLHYFDSTNLKDFPYFELNVLEAIIFSTEVRRFNAQIDWSRLDTEFNYPEFRLEAFIFRLHVLSILILAWLPILKLLDYIVCLASLFSL